MVQRKSFHLWGERGKSKNDHYSEHRPLEGWILMVQRKSFHLETSLAWGVRETMCGLAVQNITAICRSRKRVTCAVPACSDICVL